MTIDISLELDEQENSDVVHYEAILEKNAEVGLGIIVTDDIIRQRIVVQSVNPKTSLVGLSPEADGEIREGDALVGIDHDDCAHWKFTRVRARLDAFRVPVGSKVLLLFERRITRNLRLLNERDPSNESLSEEPITPIPVRFSRKASARIDAPFEQSAASTPTSSIHGDKNSPSVQSDVDQRKKASSELLKSNGSSPYISPRGGKNKLFLFSPQDIERNRKSNGKVDEELEDDEKNRKTNSDSTPVIPTSSSPVLPRRNNSPSKAYTNLTAALSDSESGSSVQSKGGNRSKSSPSLVKKRSSFRDALGNSTSKEANTKGSSKTTVSQDNGVLSKIDV